MKTRWIESEFKEVGRIRSAVHNSVFLAEANRLKTFYSTGEMYLKTTRFKVPSKIKRLIGSFATTSVRCTL